MTGIMGMFGSSAAEKQQKLAREQMKVDQARQLNTMTEDTARTGLVRQNPRGRRLLADAGRSQLPDKVA